MRLKVESNMYKPFKSTLSADSPTQTMAHCVVPVTAAPSPFLLSLSVVSVTRGQSQCKNSTWKIPEQTIPISFTVRHPEPRDEASCLPRQSHPVTLPCLLSARGTHTCPRVTLPLSRLSHCHPRFTHASRWPQSHSRDSVTARRYDCSVSSLAAAVDLVLCLICRLNVVVGT